MTISPAVRPQKKYPLAFCAVGCNETLLLTIARSTLYLIPLDQGEHPTTAFTKSKSPLASSSPSPPGVRISRPFNRQKTVRPSDRGVITDKNKFSVRFAFTSRWSVRCRIVAIVPLQQNGGPYFPDSAGKRNPHVSCYYLNEKLSGGLPHTFFLISTRARWADWGSSCLDAAKARVLIRLTHAGPGSRLPSFECITPIIHPTLGPLGPPSARDCRNRPHLPRTIFKCASESGSALSPSPTHGR